MIQPASLHSDIKTPGSPAISLAYDTPDLAAAYDRVGRRQFEHGKELVERLSLASGQRVLDIGCGTGLLTAWVADQVGPTGEVVGVDPLPLRVALASRKHPRVTAQVGRAEDLSAFADSSFDAVYLNSVLHWIPDQPRALAEAWRVLRPGGRIALNSADPKRPHDSTLLLQRVLDVLGLRGEGTTYGGSNHRVDGVRLGGLLESAGFVDIQTSEHTYVDELQDVDELIAWSRASSFGNWLAELEPAPREQVRLRLEAVLEPLRADGVIRLRRHLVFGSARRR